VAWCLDADGQAPVALGPGNKSSEAAGASTWVTWSPVVFVFLPRSDRRCLWCDPGRSGGLPLLSVNPLLVSSPGQHQKQSSPMRRPQRSWRISLRLGMLPPLMAARAAVDGFSNRYQDRFPAAVACFEEDREALLAIHKIPVRHRIRVGTTNLAEDSFQEERRRTKVIPRLRDEKAALKDGLCHDDPCGRALVPGLDQRPKAPSTLPVAHRARSGSTTHR